MSSQRHTGAFVFGMVVGALAGAAVTMLKTPTSGPELRSRLQARARQYQQQVVQTSNSVRERAEQTVGPYVQQGLEASRDIADRARSLTGSGPDGTRASTAGVSGVG